MNAPVRRIFGITADRRTLLHRALRQWISANCEIAQSWGKYGAPWWNNERASLSVFAGAIWRGGYIAYEEFSDEKQKLRKSKRKLYSGRCDIYFELGGLSYSAEAKQGWSGGTTNHDIAPRIRETLDSAHRAASQLVASGRTHRRLAIAFIVPRFKGSYKADPVPLLTRWIDQIKEIPAWDKAWVFPPASRFLKGDDNAYYPGVAIFLRQVKRALKAH